jgi:ligand-binding SRPBCC domain-containing protein
MGLAQHVGNFSQFLAADTSAPRKVERLSREIVVPASLTETFAFFADASNLQRITPPWLHFTILTPMPVEMRAGLEIAYRISLYGLPMPWQSRIDVWEPGVCFVDRQLVGPYRWWRHEHRFEFVPGGTRVIDHVDYTPRVGWVSGALVRRDLRHIFAYRCDVLRRIFRELGHDDTTSHVAGDEGPHRRTAARETRDAQCSASPICHEKSYPLLKSTGNLHNGAELARGAAPDTPAA